MDSPWFSMFFHDFPSSSHWISIPGFPSQKMFRPSFAQKGAGAVSPTQQPQLDLLQSIRWESLWGAFFFDVFDVFDVGTFWDTAVFLDHWKLYLNHVKQLSVIKKSISYSPTIHPTKSHEMTVKYGTWSGSAAWDLASFDLWRMFPGAVAGMWLELYDEEWGI